MMKEQPPGPKAFFYNGIYDQSRIIAVRSIRRSLGLALTFSAATVLTAQMPRPLFGVKYDLNGKATYTGVDSTVFRRALYVPNSFSLKAGEPRERSRIGLVMLAPVGQYTLWNAGDDEWFGKEGFSWSDEREGTGPGIDGTGFGVGIDLEAAVTYDRVTRETYDVWDESAVADLNFTELNHQGSGDALRYQVWLNYDYLEVSSCARFNVWLFHGKKDEDEDLGSALDFLSEPIQLHLDYGFGLAMPVSKYGIYYKSNDPTPGIDEQVTQNMNDVLQPTTVLTRIFGIGLRLGRLDLTYRRRLGKSDALRTLGNSYGFREWQNEVVGTGGKKNAIEEFAITIYLFGGGPKAKK